MTGKVMCVCVLTVALVFISAAGATPLGTAQAGNEAMRLPRPRAPLGSAHPAAGVPGSATTEFPEDLRFAAPCEEMSEEEAAVAAILSPSPSPSSTPPLYPPEDDITWEVVYMIKRMCRVCGCGCDHMSRNETRALATLVWREMPTAAGVENVCPSFLSQHPHFPHVPIAPSPSPFAPPPPPAAPKAIPPELKDMYDYALTHNTPRSLTSEKAFAEAHDTATDHVDRTEEISLEARDPIEIAPLPMVDPDCATDNAGSIGLSNSDVVGAASAMNSGFSPLAPSVYHPPPHQTQESRDQTADAHRAALNLLLLQTAEGVEGCTQYSGMRVSASQSPYLLTEGSSSGECAEQCLFDDDCGAWVLSLNTREPQRCALYPVSPRPVLTASVDHVTAICRTPTQAERDCVGTASFNAGLGSCLTYDHTTLHSNHAHCRKDRDATLGKTAAEACPQCGECKATPTPTPYIPPPELFEGARLPSGEVTPCLAARQSALQGMGTGPLAGWYVPQCFMDGSFMPAQCKDDTCWCVYTNGVEIPATRHHRDPAVSAELCRDAPPMDPVFPVIPEPEPDRAALALRWLAKVVQVVVSPEEICRPASRNVTFETKLYGVAKHNSTPAHFLNATLGCPTDRSLASLLTSLARCVVPALPHSPSPSPTPSISVTPSTSLSPSPSPSAPVAMCGKVSCASRGIRVHMYQQVPPGFCSVCQEGTSGPCRSPDSYSCTDYVYGAECSDGMTRCADSNNHIGHAPHTLADCPPLSAADVSLKTHVTIPTRHSATWSRDWSVVVTSGVAHLLHLPNRCAVRLLRAEAAPGGTVYATVAVSAGSVDATEAAVEELGDRQAALADILAAHGMPMV